MGNCQNSDSLTTCIQERPFLHFLRYRIFSLRDPDQTLGRISLLSLSKKTSTQETRLNDSTSGVVLSSNETNINYTKSYYIPKSLPKNLGEPTILYDPHKQYLAYLRKDIILQGEKIEKSTQIIVKENLNQICLLDGTIYSLTKFDKICQEGKTFTRILADYTNFLGWFAVLRDEAEHILHMFGNPSGTYLIRPSKVSNQLSLSMRVQRSQNSWTVKHFRVEMVHSRILSTNRIMYRVFSDKSFSSIKSFIQFCFEYAHKSYPIYEEKPLPCSYWYLPPDFEAFEVDNFSLKLHFCIGRGSFGEVWKATWDDKLAVAVKKLLPTGNMEPSRFIQEAKIMHLLNHNRIVRLLGVCTRSSDELLIITEFLELGSLCELMRKASSTNPINHKFDLAMMHSFMSEICEGMCYLEKHNFVHRDLRSANILVDRSMHLKVSDFGLSHLLNNVEEEYYGTTQTPFPVRFTAPEGMLENKYSVKSDVWSYGVLLYEIVTLCEQPYKGMKFAEIRDYVCNQCKILPIPLLRIPEIDQPICPDYLYDIMKSCWNFIPENRPSFKAIYISISQWILHKSDLPSS